MMTDQPSRPVRPGRWRGGTRKGKSNSDITRIRSMVGEALYRAGGVNYLVKQANENPGPFLQLLSKCLPKDVVTTAELGPNLAAALHAAMQRRLTITAKPLGINGLRDAADGRVIDGAVLPALAPEAAEAAAPMQQGAQDGGLVGLAGAVPEGPGATSSQD
jgi:hypothetical protein